MPAEINSLCGKHIISGLDVDGNQVSYSILFTLPIEIWLLILSKDLNEVDLRNFFKSIPLFKFKQLLDVEQENETLAYNELWKLIFKNAYKNLEFPNISKTLNDFKLELNTRIKLSNSWKHSKGIIHKYNLSYNNFRQNMNMVRWMNNENSNESSQYAISDNILFNYPKVVAYNEGNITLLNVDTAGVSDGTTSKSASNLKKSTRFTYIPCISPSNCSFYKLFNNQVVFGNNEGKLYLKQFEKKAYLNPVTEIVDLNGGLNRRAHAYGISCIEISNNSPSGSKKSHSSNVYNSNNNQHIVSIDSLGNMKIWFVNNRNSNEAYKKVFELPTVTMCKPTHIFLIDSIYKIIVLDESACLHVVELTDSGTVGGSLELLNKFTIKLSFASFTDHNIDSNKIHFVKYDYGGNNLVLGTHNELMVVRFKTLYRRLIQNEMANDYFMTYKFKDAENIQNITIDEETSKVVQNRDLLGKDGCLISVVTELKENSNYTNSYVFNIRAEESLTPQILLQFYERCYSTCVDKLLLIVYLTGRLILYNALNGEELKIIKISTSPQSKKNPVFDFNMIKMSMNKIILYGIYNNDLQFLNYNVESVKRSIEKGKLKQISKKERSKLEHLEDLQTTSHGKKKGGYVRNSSETHIDPEIVYEYYEKKQQDNLDKKNFEKFDIDLNSIEGLNLDEFEGYEDDELVQLKIALSESLEFEQGVLPKKAEDDIQFDLFGNPIYSDKSVYCEDMSEEEQLALALSLSMNNI